MTVTVKERAEVRLFGVHAGGSQAAVLTNTLHYIVDYGASALCQSGNGECCSDALRFICIQRHFRELGAPKVGAHDARGLDSARENTGNNVCGGNSGGRFFRSKKEQQTIFP